MMFQFSAFVSTIIDLLPIVDTHLNTSSFNFFKKKQTKLPLLLEKLFTKRTIEPRFLNYLVSTEQEALEAYFKQQLPNSYDQVFGTVLYDILQLFFIFQLLQFRLLKNGYEKNQQEYLPKLFSIAENIRENLSNLSENFTASVMTKIEFQTIRNHLRKTLPKTDESDAKAVSEKLQYIVDFIVHSMNMFGDAIVQSTYHSIRMLTSRAIFKEMDEVYQKQHPKLMMMVAKVPNPNLSFGQKFEELLKSLYQDTLQNSLVMASLPNDLADLCQQYFLSELQISQTSPLVDAQDQPLYLQIISKIRQTTLLMDLTEKHKGKILRLSTQRYDPSIISNRGFCAVTVDEWGGDLYNKPPSKGKPTVQVLELLEALQTFKSGKLPNRLMSLFVMTGQPYITEQTVTVKTLEWKLPLIQNWNFEDEHKSNLLNGEVILQKVVSCMDTRDISSKGASNISVVKLHLNHVDPSCPRHVIGFARIICDNDVSYRMFDIEQGEFEFYEPESFKNWINTYLETCLYKEFYSTFSMSKVNREIGSTLQKTALPDTGLFGLISEYHKKHPPLNSLVSKEPAVLLQFQSLSLKPVLPGKFEVADKGNDNTKRKSYSLDKLTTTNI